MEGFTPTDGLSEKDGGEQTDHGGEGELGHGLKKRANKL
jgi:hypothetical protein